jgi:hypothetical protein
MRRFEVYRPRPTDAHYANGWANAPDEVQYEGVVFTDGTVAIRWRTPYRSMSYWDSWDELMAVHGHPEYGTIVKWLDD